MNKIKRMLVILIIINLLSIIIINFFQNISLAAGQTISAEISKIDDTKYPGIKSMIQALEKEHPNWNFKVLYTGLKWSDVITNEYEGHGGSPKNLVPANNRYYTGDWVCSICGTRTYDSGDWCCASEEAIEYMMDPRNSLNSNDIFQFLQLSYVDCTYNDLTSMVENYSYLNNKDILNSIISIGKNNKVNPYYVIAKIIQEQGEGNSVLVKGTEYEGIDGVTYSGYYNAFNINASGNSVEEIYTNGLAYAKEQGWNTLAKSIEGGISRIANNYIAYGQDTMYLQKFNVSSTKYSYYTHQYMQNVLGAQSEGTILRNSLIELGLIEQGYTFIIPLYEGMPSTACKVPSRVSTTNNNNNNNNNTNIVDSENVSIDNKNKIIMTVPGIKGKEVLKELGTNDQIKNSSGKPVDSSSNLATGYIIGDKTVVVLGDINGDGKVKATDYMKIKNYIMKTSSLDSNQKFAADVNQDGKVKATDYMKIKNYIMGTSTITID